MLETSSLLEPEFLSFSFVLSVLSLSMKRSDTRRTNPLQTLLRRGAIDDIFGMSNPRGNYSTCRLTVICLDPDLVYRVV
ncbi:hypothetical protein SCHPADRAFT_213478 [Schizopora paradoxa]|uniref:Uncharacterized protein n=1 Tax=Schizopora paradoxa TaxID=27342 RepID=A0A0H2SH98_9AGAM|nr:hypothetical protein SCHPADRAFT_213478 [Schizopora paradoxa]